MRAKPDNREHIPGDAERDAAWAIRGIVGAVLQRLDRPRVDWPAVALALEDALEAAEQARQETAP
jgi:hypothetical protein